MLLSMMIRKRTSVTRSSDPLISAVRSQQETPGTLVQNISLLKPSQLLPLTCFIKTPPIQLRVAYQIGERMTALGLGRAIRERWYAVDRVKQRLGVRLHKISVGLSSSQTLSRHSPTLQIIQIEQHGY